MWKSKYRCFVIRSRYVCTTDNNLARVYSLIKKAVRYPDGNDRFGALLKEMIDGLETFARQRGVTGNSLYTDVRRLLTLGYDTYQLSDDDFDTVCDNLVDCIYKLQELEEIADKSCPLVSGKDETGGYDKKANSREIRIRAMHVTRDGVVGNSYSTDYYAGINQFDINPEQEIVLNSLDGGCVTLLAASEDAVTLKWRNEKYEVKFNTDVSTEECLVNNPHLSSDSLRLVFFYSNIPNYAELWSMIAKMGCDELEEKEEKHILTARKEEILHFIDKAIEKGNTGLYVAKALLTEYNNWGTCEIDSLYCFRKALLEGIESGALAPDNYFGWEWMVVAAKNNDPAEFMEDMDLYYEVLDTAAGHGVGEAIDIMDSIWEPEQIIEED